MVTCERIKCQWTRALWCLVAAGSLCLPACTWDGQLNILGYTTKPQYSEAVHTVYVPIFKNLTLYRGLEIDLTRAVIREIQYKTPFKVVSNREQADTELTGVILTLSKNVLVRTPLNEVREAETTMRVEVTWRDLRSGEILSLPRKPGGPPTSVPQLAPTTIPGTLGAPLPDGPFPPQTGPGVAVSSTATFVPELGPSLTTAFKDNVDRLATQIVSMMEENRW